MVQFSNVSLYNHRSDWQVNEGQFKQDIREIIESVNHKHSKLDIYLMRNSSARYGSESGTIRIFAGASPGAYTLMEEVIETKNASYIIQAMYLNDPTGSTVLLDDNGKVVAYKEDNHQAYYIPFQFSEVDEQIAKDIVLHAVHVIVDKAISEIANENSWLKTKNKEALVQNITKNFTGSFADKERRLRTQIENYQDYIDNYRRDLKSYYDKLTEKTRELAALQRTDDKKEVQNFINGLNKIAEHPRVIELNVEGEIVHVSIDDVYAWSEIDGKDRRFYIGNMRLEININNTDMRFFGDNHRRGYWGQDPHPHVDGSNGRACLGNVSSSIAELCSQKEIYGLFLIGMDFLENANYDDPAGRKILMWDEVDEDGNIIREGGNEVDWHCECCGEGMYEDDSPYYVYTEHDGDGGVQNGEDWCEGCREDNATYSEHVEEYVSYDVETELDEYYEEEDEF